MKQNKSYVEQCQEVGPTPNNREYPNPAIAEIISSLKPKHLILAFDKLGTKHKEPSM